MNTTTTHPPTSTTADGDVARALYDALATADTATAAGLLDPDVVVRVPGTHALAGEHRGLDGVLAFSARTRALTDDGETIEVLDVLTGAAGVAVHCRISATRGDQVLDNSTIHLLRLRDGRVTEVALHNFDGVAVDAFWSGAAAPTTTGTGS